jgi:UDP-N-acetylmuramate--alanine ligase
MALKIAQAAGEHPSWLLGAPVSGFGENGGYGSRDLMLELDESYGTFAQVEPSVLGLLNVEADHLDHYGSLEGVEQAFRELATRTRRHVVVWAGSTAHRVVRTIHSVVTVGTSADADYVVSDIHATMTGTSFVVAGPLGTVSVTLTVPGHHNVINASIAAVVALVNGTAPAAVEAGLASFGGAPRRFEVHGQLPGTDTLVIEDYAHLPSEIATAIATARGDEGRDVVAVFQPHRVTRTLNLTEEFGGAFHGLRELVVTDIYTSGEPNPTQATGEVIVEAVRRHSTVPVRYLASRESAARYLSDLTPRPDAILVIGAGDVGEVATWLVEGGAQ